MINNTHKGYIRYNKINMGGIKVKIDLTEKAHEELKKVMESKKDNKPLRIYIAGHGWGGPSFGLALDELKEGDTKTEVYDFTFLTEKDLTENFGAFTIDYSDNWLRRGFSVMPDRGGASC